MKKGSIYQAEITILNIYAPKSTESEYLQN